MPERALSTADLAEAVPEQPDVASHDEALTEQPEAVRPDEEPEIQPDDEPETLVSQEEPAGDGARPLFADEDLTDFRGRWQEVQTGFVDDPKRAVRDADELVASVISALATSFAEHKGALEDEWRHGEPATEELRIALRRYRAFFDQLLPR